MCGVCNVWILQRVGVCICGFGSVCVCVCVCGWVGFVMFGCVYV